MADAYLKKQSSMGASFPKNIAQNEQVNFINMNDWRNGFDQTFKAPGGYRDAQRDESSQDLTELLLSIPNYSGLNPFYRKAIAEIVYSAYPDVDQKLIDNNLDEYVKGLTGAELTESTGQEFVNMFEAYDTQARIAELQNLLMKTPEGSPLDEYYEKEIAELQTQIALKTKDFEKRGALGKAFIQFGGLANQRVKQITNAIESAIVLNIFGSAISGSEMGVNAISARQIRDLDSLNNAMRGSSLVMNPDGTYGFAKSLGSGFGKSLVKYGMAVGNQLYMNNDMMKMEMGEAYQQIRNYRDEEGNRVPKDIAIKYATDYGTLVLVTEQFDEIASMAFGGLGIDVSNPLTRLNLGKEFFQSVREIMSSNSFFSTLKFITGRGLSAVGEMGQEGIQSAGEKALELAAIEESNRRGYTKIQQDSFKKQVAEVWNALKTTFMETSGEFLISTLLDTGAGFVSHGIRNLINVTPKMRADADAHFNPGGKVVSPREIDTMGAEAKAPEKKVDKDGKEIDSKLDPILVDSPDANGVQRGFSLRDRQLIQWARENKITGIRVVEVPFKSNQSAAERLAQIINEEASLNSLTDEDTEDRVPVTDLSDNERDVDTSSTEGPIIGTKTGTLLVKDGAGLEKTVEYFKKNSFTSNIVRNSDGSVTIRMAANNDVTSVDIRIATQAEQEGKDSVEQVISYRDWREFETKRNADLDPYSVDNYLRTEDERRAYEAINKALPESEKMSFNQRRELQFSKLGAARIMPIVSEITGMNTSDVLDKFVFTFDTTGKLKEANAYGGFEKIDGKLNVKIRIDKAVRPDTIMHEVIHGLRSLATSDQLAGFAEAYGGAVGGMWVEDIKKTDNGWVLGDKTYKTHDEALEASSKYEERFVDDFMRYLYGETGFNDAQKSFFAKVKQFFEAFWSDMRSILKDKLDAKTVKAFDILFGKDTDAQERADFVEVAATEGIKVATELASTALEDEMLLQGYDWDRGMSNNAVSAYEAGEKPLHKWTKQELLDAVSEDVRDILKNVSVDVLKQALLDKTSWHHTGANYKRTDFYSLKDGIESLSAEDATSFVNAYNQYKNNLDEYNKKLEQLKSAETVLTEDGEFKASEGEVKEVKSFSGVYFYENGKTISDGGVHLIMQTPSFNAGKVFDGILQSNGMLYQKLAPNGKPSNLTDEQWEMVRTPEFKAWFGDWENDSENASKVVDENGEPLVMYHGTLEHFDVFDTNRTGQNWGGYASDGVGSYFTSSFKLAENWAERANNRTGRKADELIIEPVFLNIRNPYGRSIDANSFEFGYDAWDDLTGGRKSLADFGYDGNFYELKGYGIYNAVITSPNQAKSALDNNGQFSSTDNSILHQRIMDRNTQARIDADYEAVENALRANASNFDSEGNHLAPNGEKSNLTYKQWVQVRTPAFMDWFGDWLNDPENASKMLDPNGEPIVAWHGTVNEFDIFRNNVGHRHDNGFFGVGHYFVFHNFDNTKSARGEASYYGSNLIGVFLNIRNPFNIRQQLQNNNWDVSNLEILFNYAKLFPDLIDEDSLRLEGKKISIKELESLVSDIESQMELIEFQSGEIKWKINRDNSVPWYSWDIADKDYALAHKYNTIETYLKNMLDFWNDNEGLANLIMSDTRFSQKVREMGYDGIIQSTSGDEAVAFEPNQIKSATDNSGAFNTENNSILYQTATDTEEFKNWFKDSKVLDEDGNPLRLFHGTPYPGFTTFNTDNPINNGVDSLIYFTDTAEVASDFAKEFTQGPSVFRNRLTENEGGIYPVYLSMQNPLDFRSLTEEQIQKIADVASERFSIPRDRELENIRKMIEAGNQQGLKVDASSILENLSEYGYDGIIADMGIGGTEYAVVNPNQIKSVYNRGTFNSEADSILYQIEESNRIIESIAHDKNDIVSIDGLSYIKDDKGYDYNPDTIRNLKNSVSEELHTFEQLEFDFADQTTDSENGEEQGKSGEVRTDNGEGASLQPRGLRPSIAQYFHFNTGWNGEEPSIAIDNQWDNFGYVSFIGTEIYNSEDVAKLFSLYRNPRFEYFHIAFVRDGKIVGHTALSTGLPGRTFATPEGDYNIVLQRMQALNADGYYLVHNHPSGNVAPSNADIQLTYWYSKDVPGLLGHVILDHDKYHVLSGVETSPDGTRFGFRENEERNTWGFHEIPNVGDGKNLSYSGAIASYVFNKMNNDSATWALYIDNAFRPLELEPISAIPNEEDIFNALKTKRVTRVVYVTTDKEYFSKVYYQYLNNSASDSSYITDFILINPKDSSKYSSILDTAVTNTIKFGKDWQDEVVAEMGEGFRIPKWDKDDSSNTLFQLSDEERAEALKARENDIREVTQSGRWIRTEYIAEFAGQDWADNELYVRNWMTENPALWSELKDKARDTKSYEDFKEKLSKEVDAEGESKWGTDSWSEEDEALYRRLYQIAQLSTPQERNSSFIANHVMGDRELVKMAKTLREYSDLGWIEDPNRGDYANVLANVNRMDGVSNKVLKLNAKSTSAEIAEARQSVLKDTSAYRNAFNRATNRFNELDALDENLEGELNSYSEEQMNLERKANLSAEQTDWKKTAEELEKKLADAEADLEKLNKDNLTLEQVEDRLAKAREELKAYKAENKALKERQSDLSDIAWRKITEKNEEIRELKKIINAFRRREEARAAREDRKKMFKQIKKTLKIGKTTFGWNSNACDAKYLDAFSFLRGLFAGQDRSELIERRHQLISAIDELKTQNAAQDLIDNLEDELEDVRAVINGSEMKEVPAILRPFTNSLHLKADNRISKYTTEELSDILTISKALKAQAKEEFSERYNALQGDRRKNVAEYFSEIFGQDITDMDRAELREAIASVQDKQFMLGIVGEYADKFRALNAQTARLTRKLDGKKEGVLYDFFTRQARALYEEEQRKIQARLEPADRKLAELGLKTSDLNKILVIHKDNGKGYTFKKDNGQKVRLTVDQAIGVYIYGKNEDGLMKLRSASGNGITEEAYYEIIAHLTPAQKAWGDWMMAELEGHWQDLSDVMYNVYNMPLGKVENYFTFKSEKKLDGKDEGMDIVTGSSGDTVRYVNKGFTKERVRAIYPLDLHVSRTWANQVRKEEHFVAFAKWGRDANYYMDTDAGFGEVIEKKFGPTNRSVLANYAEDLISPRSYTDEFDKVLSTVVGRGASAMVAGNLSVMLKQIPTLASALGNVGVREFVSSVIAPNVTLENFLKANEIMYRDFDSARQFIYDNSPVMKTRKYGSELIDNTSGIGRSDIDNLSAKVNSKIMRYTAGLTDSWVVSTLWLGRYMTVFNELKADAQKSGKPFNTEEAHKEAVFKAGQLISETQNTSVPMDLSYAMRKAKAQPALKPFYLFSSTLMNMFNQVFYDIPFYFKNKDYKGIAKVVSFVALNMVAMLAINGAFHRKKDEDDEEYAKRLAKELASQTVSIAIPGAGGSVSNAIKGWKGSSGEISLLEDVSSVLGKVFNPSKNKTRWENFVDAMSALAYATTEFAGLPANAGKKLLQSAVNGNPGYLLNKTWGEIVEDLK